MTLALFSVVRTVAQDAAVIDSLRRGVARGGSVAEKVRRMDELSRMLMGLDPAEAFAWGGRLIALAEDSRDRKLMFDAYLSNGVCHSYLAEQKVHLEKATAFFGKALELARDNGMDREVGIAELQLSVLSLRASDKDKALGHATQAFSMLSSGTDDSLRAEAHNLYGQVYLARNENILALRNFLSALRIAEAARNVPLLRDCYRQLADFYAANPNHLISIRQQDVITGWYAFPGQNALRITDVINDHLQTVVAKKETADAVLSKMAADVQGLIPNRKAG